MPDLKSGYLTVFPILSVEHSLIPYLGSKQYRKPQKNVEKLLFFEAATELPLWVEFFGSATAL